MFSRRLLKSPLVHFFIMGLGIFAAYSLLNDSPAPADPDKIVLSEEEAKSLIRQFQATWNRPPTVEELTTFMNSWLAEEANVREALALGLDKGDAVIRQRLNLKMQFMAESTATARPADDTTLQGFLDQNSKDFLIPAQASFQQVQLEQPDAAEAAAVKVALDKGADFRSQGKASILPTAIPLTPGPIIDRDFGTGFFEALKNLPLNSWKGPIASSYGLHLVRVTDRREAVLPPLAEIRGQVEREWRSEEIRKMRESFSKSLLDRYEISIPSAESLLAK